MVNWRIKNQNIREFLAEFLGTCTLTCLGCAGNALVTLKDSGSSPTNIGAIVTPVTWGLALTVAIYVCGGVSGGHVNPAVTIGMASVGKLRWSKVLHYIAAQYLGAFVGSVLTYVVYREAINNSGLPDNKTMGIFGTYSGGTISTGTALLDQIVCTAFFLLIISAICDEKNMQVAKGFVPFAIGFANIGLLHISFGYNCGTPLNPARDFSPRLLTAIAGWGGETFSYNNYGYFWVPLIACHIGGILGCWIYRLVIENHWPSDYEFGNGNDPENKYTKGIRVTQNQ